jgi:hypothetical protein
MTPISVVFRQLLFIVTVLSLAFTADAQGRTLWLSADDGATQTRVERNLRELLSSSADDHLVGEQGLAERLSASQGTVPPCLDGRGTCSSLQIAAAQSFGIRQLVTVRVIEEADEEAEVSCLVTSPDDSYEREIQTSAGSVRAALLECVGAITEGRGRVKIDTEPTGASIRIDNELAGTTPIERSLAVGVHLIHIEKEGFHDVQQAIEVRPNDLLDRTIPLERSMAIMLVKSATPDAVVQLDGADQTYPIGEEVLIEPGPHTVRVTAPGYNPIERDIEFAEGERVELRAALALSDEEITRREQERIKARPIMLQGGIHFSRFHTNWSGATVDGITPETDIECAIRPTTGTCDRPGVTTFGLNIELSYAWDWFELQPIGIGYRFLAMSDRGTDYRLENDQLRLSHQRAHRWMFRIAHVGARYLIDEYWEPYARIGLTVNLDRGKAEDLLGDTGEYKFKRTGLEFELRAGTRFHINSLFYGYGELLFAAELKNAGTKPSWGISGGVGVNLPDPFRKSSETSSSEPPAEDGALEPPEGDSP